MNFFAISAHTHTNLMMIRFLCLMKSSFSLHEKNAPLFCTRNQEANSFRFVLSPHFSLLLFYLTWFISAQLSARTAGSVALEVAQNDQKRGKEKRREEKELRVESINQSFTIDREGWLGRLAKASN